MLEEKILKFFDNINVVFSSIITGISVLFNGERILFIGYLIFNIIDFITGNIKARINKTESSAKGIKGIIKKVGYWILILVSFLSSYMLNIIGKLIGINMEFVIFFGWFTLGCLIINEIRSILENIKEIGIEVPNFLVKGLEIVEKIASTKEKEILNKQKEGENVKKK